MRPLTPLTLAIVHPINISVAIELSHPLSQGSVHITSATDEHTDTNEGVSVDPHYLVNSLDLKILARQVRFTKDAITRAEPIVRHLKSYYQETVPTIILASAP
ncbi:hypothetical protein PFICI_04947 [Pestalotiopsis fici W106-1]|uniref:Uncharacterized protein n=1 Tax=Pestalotiopsis fici (strain W106-1 / CGMCC3.15140) TaxID=1229662 RepID=W3XD11_PESFW|nr:uncharacterized protein PFICI_04947 [Pestalotiopsis fici W106-1]ETS83071.1 hypothetical protein PFICI_04947 [Pestalotiopsis fici W106-1]